MPAVTDVIVKRCRRREIVPMISSIYLILLCTYVCFCKKNDYLITKSYLDTVWPLSVGLKFIAEVNNTSELDYLVEANPDRCCLVADGNEDCDSLQIVGGCQEIIAKGTTKNLTLIAPMISPFERQGYCIFYLDSHVSDRKRSIMRDEIKVQFDTRFNKNRKDIDRFKVMQPCQNIDEDPMNECKPVDCEVHYNGAKNFYSEKIKRCVETPACVTNDDAANPEVIYNPTTNKCVRETGISDDDIKYINSLTDNARHAKDILIIKNVVPKEDYGLDDKNSSEEDTPVKRRQKVTKAQGNKISCKTVTAYLMSNKYILIVLTLVILLQCCLICTMIYCLSISCSCCRKKKVESKYFNYRQDVSVTTPLIYTSNIDTETTDYQFLTDSSNVDKKIKCYKACQKERKSNAKLSMSDDILSKCLNRRKWDRTSKSDAIPETNENGKDKIEKIATKVDFDYVKLKDEGNNVEDNNRSKETELKFKIQRDFSEKEIKCHTYNYTEDRRDATHVNPRLDKGLESKDDTPSNSIEKGAQISFSNDSIDDFISERGLITLADVNLSNSLLNSSETEKTSASLQSSKTSKNNVVKNVLSFFSRKSKPSSVPGTKKSKDKLDLELIHMSRASMFSSSRSDRSLNIKNSKTSM